MEFAPGSYIAARYRVVRFLGEGAVSGVYESIDEQSPEKTRVAVKVLHRDLSENPETVVRFEREAQAANQIGSPHITQILGIGKTEQGHFMVLEYLEGQTLQDRLRQRKVFGAEEAVELMCQLLDGLSMAHQLGIVHRDLKPANLMLVKGPTGGDFVKILDFGASKLSSLSSAITKLGAMVGTPMYMSPEQIRASGAVDARADVYACGVILYQCVTGKVPFDAKNPAELAFRVVTQDPPPPESHLPSLDPELSAIIRRAMARDAAQRFPAAHDMRAALAHWLARKTGGAPPPSARAMPVPPQIPQAPLAPMPAPLMQAPPVPPPASAPRPSFSSAPQSQPQPYFPQSPPPAHGSMPSIPVIPSVPPRAPLVSAPPARPLSRDPAVLIAVGLAVLLAIAVIVLLVVPR